MFSFVALRRSGDRVRRIVGRPVGLIVSAAAIAAVITGIALADAGSPPGSGYVTVSPAHRILSGTVGAGATLSEVAVGGSTTVPTNATAVQMTVTAKDTKAGSVQIFPAGDPTAGGATSVTFAAGTTATATVNETVGASSKISFKNTAAATVTVTATITGYSTQLTAANIAPDGGSSGQVLTNTGTGASWQNLPQTKAFAQSQTELSGGVLLSNTSPTSVATVVVPAGSYVVTFTGTVFNGNDNSSDFFVCHLVAPSGNNVSSFDGSGEISQESTVSNQVLLRTSGGGTIAAKCQDTTAHTDIGQTSLIAMPVDSVSGYVGS
jgi:hypothetical protein